MKAVRHRLQPARLPLSVWRCWVASLLAIVALLLLDLGRGLLQDRVDTSLLRVVVNGEPLVLDAETRAEFGRDLEHHTAGLQDDVAAAMRPWLDERLEAAFTPLEAAVPGYLDWYYLLTGNYLRLGMAVAGDQRRGLRPGLRDLIRYPALSRSCAIGDLAADSGPPFFCCLRDEVAWA
ncbi:hypothetical protein ACM26W_12395 [Halomonas sp. HK25]|uniref:hypothetical protein n=1 Tax=Halomonas sp. HK25 TaxID=3394321 RepID=UPI0039FDB43D